MNTFQLTRLDKNITHNALDLKAFGEEENLISNILFYIAYSYQTDLFGFGVFDPAHFAKAMGYTKGYLFSKIEAPLKLKGLSKTEVQKMQKSNLPENYSWDCVLDNALYRLAKENITLTYGGEAYEGMQVASIRSIQVLEDVDVYFDPKNRNKKYYQYRPSEKFINNLSKRFVMLDKGAFITLSRMNLQRLYMYLTDLRNSMIYKRGEKCTPNFDMLCNLANVHAAEDKHKKKRLKEKIEKVLKIATHLKGSLTWEKNGSYYYKPVLTFDYEDIEVHTKKELENVFRLEVRRQLLKSFEFLHQDEEDDWRLRGIKEDSFLNWLNDTKKDRKDKGIAYLQAQLKVYGKSAELNDPIVNKWIQSLARVDKSAFEPTPV